MKTICLITVVTFLMSNEVQVQARTIGTRIIGGESANAGQFPFAAAIYIQTTNGTFFCGGALLNNDWLITSGHCAFDAVLFTIILGSHALNAEGTQVVATSDFILYEGFNPDTIENDLALIKLRVPILFSDYIEPINLSVINLLNDTDVVSIGWGQTSDVNPDLADSLQYVRVNVLSNFACRQIYGDQITDNMACVEGDFNQGTCHGDNGGPLVRSISRLHWIVGVASFISSNGCESTDPSGYTRTYPYRQWIANIISG